MNRKQNLPYNNNNNIKGVNTSHLLSDQYNPFFMANPYNNSNNEKTDFNKVFDTKKPPMIVTTDFSNKSEVIHQNMNPVSILRDKIYEYNIVIDSRDRDVNVYPNPFDFKVSIDPFKIGSNSTFQYDSSGNIVIDPITKEPVLEKSVMISAPGPIIKPQIRKVKYVQFVLAKLPKSYTMRLNNILENNTINSDLLVLDNDRFLMLDVKELRNPEKYSTNDSLTNSFAILSDNEVSNKFHYTSYGCTEPIVFKNPLSKLDMLTVKIRDSEGKLLEYPFLKNCRCCSKKTCINTCCDKTICKDKSNDIDNKNTNEVKKVPVVYTNSITLNHNIQFPFINRYTNGSFVDNSDYPNGSIDWKISGGVLQPIVQTLDLQFIGAVDPNNKNKLEGELTVIISPDTYTFDCVIKFTKNEFEVYIDGSTVNNIPTRLTVKGFWDSKTLRIVCNLYGIIFGSYINVPLNVDLMNLLDVPIILFITQNQIVGSIESDISIKSLLFNSLLQITSTTASTFINKFKSKLEICFDKTKNKSQPDTCINVEGSVDIEKKIMTFNLCGMLQDSKINGSGSLTITQDTKVAGTVTIIKDTPNNIFSSLITGSITDNSICGTLSGFYNNISYSWDFCLAYESELDSFQLSINGEFDSESFLISTSLGMNIGCAKNEICPQGFIGGNILVADTIFTLQGDYHQLNYLPNKFMNSFIISLFNQDSQDYVLDVSGIINQTITINSSMTNITTTGDMNGNLIAPGGIIIPFEAVLSSEIDLEKNNFVIVVNGPNISLIITGSLIGNFLMSGGSGLTTIDGTIAGVILDQFSNIISNVVGTVTGVITGNNFIITINNTDDNTQFTVSFNTNASLKQKKELDQKCKDSHNKNKSCCDCCISCLDPRLQTLLILKVGVMEPDIDLNPMVLGKL